jgi:hypothetical protein
MKRLVDGVTYNTNTATLLAESEYQVDWNNRECPTLGLLYQTRGGAFFIAEYITIGEDHDGEDVHKIRFLKCSEDGARLWINTGKAEVHLNPFEDKDSEKETTGTVYVRMPVALKRQIEAAAEAESLSASSWAMRCFKKCLSSGGKS